VIGRETNAPQSLQSAYLEREAAPWMFDAAKARILQETLAVLLGAILDAARLRASGGAT